VRLQQITKMAYLLLAVGLQFAHFAQSRRTGRPKHARPLFESRHGGLHVLLLFLIFNDSCQVNYLKIYQINLWQIFSVGKTMAADDSEISFSIPRGTLPWEKNLCRFYPQN